jgi:hypothetical protein
MAREFGLAASRGSDFHSPDESHTDLGTLPPLPGPLTRLGFAGFRTHPATLLTHSAMAQYFEVHPDNPQPRLLKQAAALLQKRRRAGRAHRFQLRAGLPPGRQGAADQLRRIRQVDDKHHLTLLCRDLSRSWPAMPAWTTASSAC